MKKLQNEKLALTTTTIRKLTDPKLALAAGASYGSCLITSTCYTRPTGGCQ